MPSMSHPQLETALDKIRVQKQSKLPHQKAPATLLIALEQTFDEQVPPATRSPVAYCAALCTTLEQAVKRKPETGDDIPMGEGDFVPGALYLLASVLPHVTTPVVRAQVPALLPLLALLLPISLQHPPALRSVLSVLGALWAPLDTSTLTGTPLLRNAWASVLRLCIDPRPKVRKKAQEVVKVVLAAPPAPLMRHPYADQTVQFLLNVLIDVSPDRAEIAIWTCAWARTLTPFWPPTKLVDLLQSLLALPTLNIPFLTEVAYNTITTILTPAATGSSPELQDSTMGSVTQYPATLPSTHLPASLATILSAPPTSDADAVPWIGAVGACLRAWGHASRDLEILEETPSLSQDLLLAVPSAFRALWSQLEESHASDVRSAAENAIVHGLLGGIFGQDGGSTRVNITQAGKANVVADLMIKECLKVWGKGPKNAKKTSLGLILTTLEESLDSVSAASSGALGNILSIAEGVISVLGVNSTIGGGSNRQPTCAKTHQLHRDVQSQFNCLEYDINILGLTPATSLAPPLLGAVGNLRAAKGFVWKENADRVIGAAICAMGPISFLEVLPINLIPDKEAPSRDGRAYLLPLLAANLSPRTSDIRHFVSYFVPLSEKLFELQTSAEKEGERKIWEVCIDQVWNCFRGYCTGLAGLKEGLSTPFLQLLTNLLYTQPTLRVSILHGIRALVASNRSIPADEIHYNFAERSCAEENLKFLASLVGNMLSVLFNVFSNVESNDRGLVGEVISLWLGLADTKELSNTFKKVSAMLAQNLEAALTPLAHTTLDLLVLLIPHLSSTDGTRLFEIVFTNSAIASSDGTVQKKAYRILARLVERGIVDGLQEGDEKNARVESVLARFVELTSSVNVAAKRDRIQLLAALVPLIPYGTLHIIPSLLPEAILATKEVSEKARNSAFDLVVEIGKRMEKGGIVDRGKVDGMDMETGEAQPKVKASIEEYITMVAAGLVGATPHMISATITALSRLTFEFKSTISHTMLSELVTTIIVFVSSANREIVKSALGFAKVSVICLPTAVVNPHLGALVPALLGWSHDHKNHFKSKVVHMLERMGRRFGWEALETAAGNHERAGVVAHLRKKKERAKRKKEKQSGQGSDAEDVHARATAGDAFEDVLYGSNSGSSDVESENESRPAKGSKQNPKSKSAERTQKSGMRIRLDNDEPMDLLHGSASRLTTGAAVSARRRQPGQDASKFKTEAATGRMVIEESADEDEDDEDPTEKLAGDAYREMLTSTDGHTRDANGKVKFSKDTKKRRAAEREAERDDDVEMADGTERGANMESPKKKKKQEVIKVGAEYKAKNAGGDVKKPGKQDPYAYLPLGSLNKKKGRPGPRISITGRR
ncbi:Ribosomal RNA-processing protein 12 [Ceratobasidium theobromae]|uniref:Ribosomal RNA-processing protein 12 n=1 Tax=Ceratobasidium theobromae TaxID=1582974 RepID=A0A5N5QKI0_9AGAM|nr:Ribosomal RNA-processing protein 12 [Ceratobasidium theobromae]